MRLAEYTDYTLRVLMYCASHPDRLITIAELAERHEVSKNHLMKVVNDLARQGVREALCLMPEASVAARRRIGKPDESLLLACTLKPARTRLAPGHSERRDPQPQQPGHRAEPGQDATARKRNGLCHWKPSEERGPIIWP